MFQFQFMYFILTHNAAYAIIYLTREHSLNGLPCWFLRFYTVKTLLGSDGVIFFAKNHVSYLLYQVSDNKSDNIQND